MSSKRNILVLALLLLPAFLYTASTPPARAQTANIVAVSPTAIADLSKVSGSVTFELNVTDSAPFNLFLVSVQYGQRVLKLHPGGLDFTGTVIGTNIIPVEECVDGVSLIGGNCGSNDMPGVVTLSLVINGAGVTSNPTSGELFNVTFDVIGTGVSQIHILQALLANNGNQVQTESFDGYFSNKQCGTAICSPPIADFTVAPPVLIPGASATFNASNSHSTNPGGTITSYSWTWGASNLLPSITANPVVHQIYTLAGNFTVNLTVNDTYHIQGSMSRIVQVKASQPPTSHAGEVCLADPRFGNPTTGLCPLNPQAFSGPSHNPAFPGLQLRVAVNINNSASINGFDITLKANPTILQPFDADLNGTLLQGTATILVKCIGGKVVLGNACVPTDTTDTIHFIAASTLLSNPPTTGLLFTAVYNIVGNATGPISVGFQTGCGSAQIPTSDPPLCITIVNGGNQAVPETAVAATYSTVPGQPFFSMQASPNTFRFSQGTAATGSSTISLAELFGFSCGGLNCVNLSATSPFVTGLSTSLIPSSLTDSGTSTLMISTNKLTPGGNFSIFVVGKPDTVNTPLLGTTYLGSVVVVTVIIVGTPDFSISINPQTLLIPTGTSASSNVTLVSLNQFSGVGTFAIQSVIPICCPSAPPPTATLVPNSFTLTAGGTFTSTLTISTSNTGPPDGSSSWNVIVFATNGMLAHSATESVVVTAPPDKPPVANFTISPTSPVAGQPVFFDGSGSHDPDGVVASWQWNFGDGSIGFGEFFNHPFTNSGSFTVVLTVTDNAGLSGSTSMLVNVRAQPLHDVSIVSVNVIPSVVVSDQIASVEVAVRNDGLRNETVSVSAFFDSHVIGTVNGVFVRAGNCGFLNCNPVFVSIAWDTTGVAAGNYTISATVFLANDPTPADNTLKDGTVRVLPPPVLTLTPSSGSLGTLVTVHGSGFPNPSQGPFFSPVEIQMTFDDQLLGFFFLQGSSFNFSFDVPHAQPGIVHHVHAIELFPFSLNVQADFLVLPEPGNLSVSVDTGAIYFPGDTAVIYVLTSQGGVPVGPANVQMQITLVLPNGTNVALAAKSVSTGLFKATYAVPTTGSLGTYGLVVAAHSSAGNGSALAGFEVKPTWLSQNGNAIMGASAIAGVVGVVALSWQKGYLSRRKDQPPLSLSKRESSLGGETRQMRLASN